MKVSKRYAPKIAKPKPERKVTSIACAEARAFLLGHLGLNSYRQRPGARGVRDTLNDLRAIQLDPLDPMGTNADLVLLARVEGIRRGEVFSHLFPGHAFEHFCKERCLLPASAYPYYRDQASESPWWRQSERLKRLKPAMLDAVLAEVRERGPVSAADLTDHGSVEPLDWNGWKGTGKSTSMALEVLWLRCKVVVAGRSGRGKIYDIPERALAKYASAPSGDFARWAIGERVEAAGLLSRNSGPHWTLLRDARMSPLPNELIDAGVIEEVRVEGAPTTYLAPHAFLRRKFPPSDDRMRILGPLDPLLWDRKLIAQIFNFDYVWEVYKPAHQRRWGWYVCPLLHRGKLVGRIEGRVQERCLVINRIWREADVALDEDALRAALERHAGACNADSVKHPNRILKEVRR
jgi:uncharacterized protein